MKVAIFRTFPAPLKLASYNIQEIGLAKGLLNSGVSVDIYSFFEGINVPEIHSSRNNNEIRLIPLNGLKIGNRISLIRGISKIFSTTNYDIVQVHENSQLMNAFILNEAKKHSIKTVLYQGVYKNYSGLGGLYQKIFETLFQERMKKRIDFVFAKTTSAKKFLEKKGFTKVKILPVGLDIYSDNKNESFGEFQKFRKRIDKLFLYVGILEKRRDVSFFLKVLKQLSKEESNPNKYGLLIVGTGPDQIKIKNLINNYELESNVMIIDSVPNREIGNIFAKCDLFALPSHYEIFGMVMLEALYNGTPVFSTPTAGPLDVIKNENHGKILDFDVNAWCKAIQLFFSKVEQNRGKSSLIKRNYILENYTWDKIAKEYLEILFSIKN